MRGVQHTVISTTVNENQYALKIRKIVMKKNIEQIVVIMTIRNKTYDIQKEIRDILQFFDKATIILKQIKIGIRGISNQ